MSTSTPLVKPLLRGHFHQAAFFIALGACSMLIAKSSGQLSVITTVVYSVTLLMLFAISALYHRPQWSITTRAWWRRMDHSAIFLLIGGTCVPICLLGLKNEIGTRLLTIVLAGCFLGIIQSIFWVAAPKWLTALLCVVISWLIVPFSAELFAALGNINTYLLFAGGIIYTLGAIVYAVKFPNFYPKVFGYHEVFHLLVVIAAICHFILVYRIN